MGNKEVWEQKHRESEGRFNYVTEFARFCYDNYLRGKQGKLLDLCCGKGADSIFFHYKGFKVTAIDYSSEAIKQFNELQRHKKLFIITLVKDISGGLHFDNESYDIVYSRLGLHYFADSETRLVFSEIRRILKSDGLLLFQVKSVNDKDFGNGTEMEKDMFESPDLERRHFFSREYTEEVLDGFDIIYLDEKKLENGNSYIDVIARKK